MRKLAALLLFILCLVSCACAEEEYQTVETEHFTISVPKTWTKGKSKSGDITLLENPLKGTTQGDAALVISEDPFTFGSLSKEEFYDILLNKIKKDSPNHFYHANIQIDHQNAIYYQYLLKTKNSRQDEVHAVACALPSENTWIMMVYVHAKSDDPKAELINLLRSVKLKSTSVKKTDSETRLVKYYSIGYAYLEHHQIIEQDGACYLLVEYVWIHFNDEPTSFWRSFKTEAYQNGIQCHSVDIKDSDRHTKVQSGLIFPCYDCFLLHDAENPVTLRIGPALFSMDFRNNQYALEHPDEYEPEDFILDIVE